MTQAEVYGFCFREERIAMSEQDCKRSSALQRPTNDDKVAWKVYWKQQGQPWRWEPEIDTKRQKYLDERRGVTPVVAQGFYLFKNVKLSRADVEWLLATHERNERASIDWSDENQRERQGLDLRGADLSDVDFHDLPLSCLHVGLTEEERPRIPQEQYNNMAGVCMNEARLRRAHLEGANLRKAHLAGANLSEAHLAGANLIEAYFDNATRLNRIILGDSKHGFASLGDVHWGDVNLSVVNWLPVKMLGDESSAREGKELYKYQDAVRANRQLTAMLYNHGLNEDAARFAYRAQKLQRVVFRKQRKFGQYLFSLFLDLLAGYGYKPVRSFLAYLLVITAFATVYYVIGHAVGPVLSPVGSIVFSMTSFHGRGFFPGGIKLDDPLTVLAAIEAFVGLLIEVTFIATLTQRFFGK